MIIQNLGNTMPPAPPTGDGSVSSSVPSPATPPVTAAVTPGQPNQNGQATSSQSAAQVKAAVDSINQSMLLSNRGLTFSVDQDTKETVVKVVEDGTGTVIKQIPSEQALAIAKAIDNSLQQDGALIRQKA